MIRGATVAQNGEGVKARTFCINDKPLERSAIIFALLIAGSNIILILLCCGFLFGIFLQKATRKTDNGGQKIQELTNLL